MGPISRGLTLLNLGRASSLRISLAAKILPSRRWSWICVEICIFFNYFWDMSLFIVVWFLGGVSLQKVPFLSEDLELECEGKDKYKCGSNVFWKWWTLIMMVIPNSIILFSVKLNKLLSYCSVWVLHLFIFLLHAYNLLFSSFFFLVSFCFQPNSTFVIPPLF